MFNLLAGVGGQFASYEYPLIINLHSASAGFIDLAELAVWFSINGRGGTGSIA